MTDSRIRASAPRSARRFGALSALTALALAVGGCAYDGEPANGLVHDPYEATNRDIHEFNKGWDTILLRPAAKVYDAAMPGLGDLLLTNAVNMLRMPMIFANHLLQGDFEAAGEDFLRTGINLVMGAGVLDPATEFGLPYNETGIGETLYVWGVEEGPYIEIPFLGPATARDGFGRVADIALDPFGFISGHEAVVWTRRGMSAADVVSVRAENMALVDQVLYESEDSYVTTQAGYIQARRRKLAGGATEDSLTDVFAD